MSSELDSELKKLETKFSSWTPAAEPVEDLARVLTLLQTWEKLGEDESRILAERLPGLAAALLKCKTM